jgi:imidazolonepropionase-like amidohydrolase
MFREALDEGAEQIKVYDYIHPDVFEALVDMCNEYEIRIVGHKPKYVSVYAFAAKALTLEHSHTVGFEDVGVLSKTGIVWVPTLVSCAAAGDWAEPQDPGMKRLWEDLRKEDATCEDISGRREAVLDREMEKVRAYRSLGGRAAVGTNSPNPGILPGESFHREMELLASCGYSCREVLEAATRGSAAALELEDRKGTLETGKDADILLLKENPLENLANAGKIERVMLMGGWIDE